MKLKYVKYKNYRCFSDIEVNFNTTDEKNISMVVAPNGGGKTEMLFSFWWVLYDFDFKKLKGKGYTPYSLNSTLYQELKNGKPGEHEECSVILCFEDNGIVYTVTREEQYIKNNTGISNTQKVTLEQKLKSGATLPLIRDAKIVENTLSRIVPKNILGGIIFDGERMKQLSQIDDDARKAVEGVIKQITNEELFERCRIELETLQKNNSNKIKECTKRGGAVDLNELENRISTLTTAVLAETKRVERLEETLESYDEKLAEIHDQLASLEDSRHYEEQRSIYKSQLSDTTKSLDAEIEKLFKDLYQGSMLITDKLVNDVRDNLENIDVPSGLNVSAVKSILLRPSCICGHHMTEDMRTTLTELIKNLPPDNINSTLMEIGRQINLYSSDIRSTLKSTYTGLSEKEKKIEELKDEISRLSTLITEGASAQAKSLEEENKDLNRRYGEVESTIRILKANIENNSDEIERLKKLRDQASKGNEELDYYNKRDAYIIKCLNAIKAIHEFNKQDSIKRINKRISEIYSEISEDKGRNLYITQFGDSRKKYRLVTYLKEDFKKRKAKYSNNGTIHRLQTSKMKIEEIEEIIINELAQNSSTGQSKINSLAFAKAILEYSSETRDEKSTEISRSFPFMIDSPFTELSDNNLILPAKNIHTFADQIILLISQESLDGVKEYIDPYVNSVTILEKKENETSSRIKE